LVPAPGTATDALAGLLAGRAALQLGDVAGEVGLGFDQVAAQRAHGDAVGAGRAAEAEVDAAGVERGERAELLRRRPAARGWAA
jgi:hypothetical protein